ncbi:MAG: hypothetical protein IIA72_19805 [Proteobacteria bacterium]|nr:hypothetical protein [Pseudomonadota bacterium]
MRSRIIVPALLVCCGLALSGCETYKKLVGHHAPFGTENLIDRESFQKIDLAAVLTGGDMQLLETDESDVKRKNLEKALKEFNKKIEEETTDDGKKWLRNRVQERILAASNQACAEFKRELKALDARVNFILGSLTTAVAGAGAIFSGGTSQALSGIASIFSGVRAEFNEDYFKMLTIQVITDGLGKRRHEIYTKILVNRKNGLTEYPVERAIADAILYHDNCSLVAGLEQAALSIERAANPGINELKKLKEMEKVLRKIEDKEDKSPKGQEAGERTGDDGGGN